jgi:hypothetical protein
MPRLAPLAALLVLALSGPVLAQGSLFQRGSDMLKDLGIGAPMGSSGGGAALGESEIANGLKEALRVGADRVVGQLGQVNAFNRSNEQHIPLPDTLRKVQSALSRVGMSSIADDLELRLDLPPLTGPV